MKYLKIIMVTAASLMAFAGTASADIVTSPTGHIWGAAFHASAEGHVVLDNPIAEIRCPSTIGGGHISQGQGTKASIAVSTLSFNGCTEWHTTVVNGGVLSIEHLTGTQYDGDVYWDGATVEGTRFGITCRYATDTTTVGRLTGGNPATLHIDAEIDIHSGSFLCGSSATTWTGSYLVTAPASLYVDNT
jgi:hypothetical protein